MSVPQSLVAFHVSQVYKLTAWNLIDYGKIKEAVSLLEQLSKIREQTLAEDYPTRLASQHVLAMAYGDNGQAKAAVSLLEQIVKTQEQKLAKDDPNQLASQQVLATMYWYLGRRNAALYITKHVVEIRRQVLDEHHPARASSEGRRVTRRYLASLLKSKNSKSRSDPGTYSRLRRRGLRPGSN